ncbi:ABC transporter ATP-binding protein [Jiangella anatolica]|uniref:ABC transporter ATP-binding protein n=1 Tax=Jiangella anatolica TaxID=2670374 RepID=A0A2W2C489_9ACTN|nr:ABC transporter ATP-binding protein [Jiangella anatolica]
MLSVEGLRVTGHDGAALVDDVTFSIRPGETVALVGESGSGKSLTAKAIAGLLPRNLTASGSIRWRETEVVGARERVLRTLRGPQVSMLLQDPFTLLNPLTPVWRTLAETLPGRGAELRLLISERISDVGIEPARARDRYPWELSGGMRQRIGLAAALSQSPALLLADEPTTALDATTQRDVLRLIHRLQRGHGMAMLLITHDLRIATSMSDRVVVMAKGGIVESGDVDDLRSGGRQEYTRRLWAAQLPVDRRLADLRVEARLDGAGAAPVPDAATGGAGAGTTPILVVRELSKSFAARGHGEGVQALDRVGLELARGRSLGVIGESGSGKTTLARCILGLEQPTSGTVELTPGIARRQVQCVFQDPYSSLNPSHSIGFALAEAVRHRAGAPLSRREVAAEIAATLHSVGLDASFARRRPETLSGGQRQRVAIARALLLRPEILVCDEPVAALDLTVQSQVLQVLRDAQAGGLSMVFITHDMSVARQLTDEVIVLHKGRIVETGPTASVLDDPQHEYTARLLASVPSGDREWIAGPPLQRTGAMTDG